MAGYTKATNKGGLHKNTYVTRNLQAEYKWSHELLTDTTHKDEQYRNNLNLLTAEIEYKRIRHTIFADDTCLDIYDINKIHQKITHYVNISEPNNFLVQREK